MERDRVRKLARIIVQVRLKNVSDADRAYLNDWLDEDERNRTMYRRIVRGECIARRLRQEDEISKSVNYIEVEKSVIHLLETGTMVSYWFLGRNSCCLFDRSRLVCYIRRKGECRNGK